MLKFLNRIFRRKNNENGWKYAYCDFNQSTSRIFAQKTMEANKAFDHYRKHLSRMVKRSTMEDYNKRLAMLSIKDI